MVHQTLCLLTGCSPTARLKSNYRVEKAPLTVKLTQQIQERHLLSKTENSKKKLWEKTHTVYCFVLPLAQCVYLVVTQLQFNM